MKPHIACSLAPSLVAALTLSTQPQQAWGQQSPVTDRTRPLVTTTWLAQHLGDEKLVLLHIGEQSEYDAEHIPGARYVRTSDILVQRASSGLRNEFPTPEALRASFEAVGVSDDSRIVVYCGNDWRVMTARVALALDYIGLGAQSSVLDGGLRLWRDEGRTVTAAVTPFEVGRLSSRPVRGIVVNADWVAEHLGLPGYAIVDARPAELFSGAEASAGVAAGHVPGAGNLPYSDLWDEAGRLRKASELERLFREAGVETGDTVVAYCHTGMAAAPVLLAARTLGHDIRLYDGSFEEWGTAPNRPVEVTPRR